MGLNVLGCRADNSETNCKVCSVMMVVMWGVVSSDVGLTCQRQTVKSAR